MSNKPFQELINPKEWLQLRSKDIVEVHRHLTCPFYDICLNYAVQKDWNGFTCKDCFVRILEQEKGEKNAKEKEDN